MLDERNTGSAFSLWPVVPRAYSMHERSPTSASVVPNSISGKHRYL